LIEEVKNSREYEHPKPVAYEAMPLAEISFINGGCLFYPIDNLIKSI
jgi:hypothetical protein